MRKTKEKSGKKIRKVLLVVLISLAFIILVPILCYGIVNLSQKGKMVYIEQMKSLAGKDVAIVPGTSGYEGSITAKAEDRLKAAIQLYEAGLVRQIIVSGDEKEIKPMTQYLMKKGIPSESLSSDAKGVDTYDTIARAKEKFGDLSYYFCTQELYSSRAGYLMDRLDVDGTVVCVDTMYYSNAGKNEVREFFATTKAVFEPVVLLGNAKTSVEKEDFVTVEKPLENPHFVYKEEVETPEDCKVVDENPEDDYDVEKAVAYARTYAFESNPAYGQFELNCTNFVSQCLVAGGITMKGEAKISQKKRWNISDEETEWYSGSERCYKDGLIHYSMSDTFVKTDAFFDYFTKKQGYTYTRYENNYKGNLKCYQEIAVGDVLVLYNDDGTVAHLGLVSGIGEKNVYYCGNTEERKDFSVFTISEEIYSKMGILHMSKK